jgi:hypothetical protein
MAYIKKDDYSLRISQDNLDQILAQAVANTGLTEDQIREDAEQTAQTEISAYLTGAYIIEDEFSKDATTNDTDRNKIVLKCVLDMALYFIHWVINPRDIPLIREKAYTNCQEMMAAFRDSDLIFLVPPAVGGIAPRLEEDGGTKGISMSGQVKFVSKPYSNFIDEFPEDQTI